MSRRRMLERLVQRSAPGVDADFRPPAEPITDGVWALVRRLRIPPGPALPSRTTLVRQADGGLVLVSPPPPHPETYAAIDALGTVRRIVAPNWFHYLYVADAVRRYPAAVLHLAPGLAERVPELPQASALPSPALGADFDQIVLDSGRGACEVVLHHRGSRTLILTDCAFNLVDVPRLSERVFWRLFGVPPRFGPSRTARLLLLPRREQAAPVLRQILAWPFERILMAHGDVVEHDAHAAFARAFAKYL